jgi:hypothetical protein
MWIAQNGIETAHCRTGIWRYRLLNQELRPPGTVFTSLLCHCSFDERYGCYLLLLIDLSVNALTVSLQTWSLMNSYQQKMARALAPKRAPEYPYVKVVPYHYRYAVFQRISLTLQRLWTTWLSSAHVRVGSRRRRPITQDCRISQKRGVIYFRPRTPRLTQDSPEKLWQWGTTSIADRTT